MIDFVLSIPFRNREFGYIRFRERLSYAGAIEYLALAGEFPESYFTYQPEICDMRQDCELKSCLLAQDI